MVVQVRTPAAMAQSASVSDGVVPAGTVSVIDDAGGHGRGAVLVTVIV